jgi:hypothetical protein
VRERGGPDAKSLLEDVLLKFPEKFKRPTEDEIGLYDVYFGPKDRPSDEVAKKANALIRGKH